MCNENSKNKLIPERKPHGRGLIELFKFPTDCSDYVHIVSHLFNNNGGKVSDSFKSSFLHDKKCTVS